MDLTTPVNPTNGYAARAERLQRAAVRALDISRKDPLVTLLALSQRLRQDPAKLSAAMRAIEPSWQPPRGGNRISGR